MKSILVVTGLSGAGKSTAIHALEDAGWTCIDNLPAPLLLRVTELGGERDKLAFGIDAREGDFLQDVPWVLNEAKRTGHEVVVVFLDASDDALTRRYKETRRRHPLAEDEGVTQGIAKERTLLQALRDQSQYVLDTSMMTVHELRRKVMECFSPRAANQLRLTVMSFGFKHGVPLHADLMFDARFLPNPFFVAELKHATGLEAKVADYVLVHPDAQAFLQRVVEFVSFLLPRYRREGRAYVVVAIGCTGGKHRSVAITQALVKRLNEAPLSAGTQLQHRDIAKE